MSLVTEGIPADAGQPFLSGEGQETQTGGDEETGSPSEFLQILRFCEDADS